MTLLTQLNTLETTGLVRLATVQPELEYLFRHALVQDAAYGSLLKNDRKHLHQSVGEALETLYPQQRDELAATLALHFEKAEQRDKAAHYYRQAGDRASEGFANAEALAFYQAAIAQVELALQRKRDNQWQGRLAELLESLADVHARMGQHELTREVCSRALATQGTMLPPNPVMQARLHRKIGTSHVLQRNFPAAGQAFEQAEQYLGDLSNLQPDAVGDEWIELQEERLMFHYWKSDVPGMNTICERLLPVVERMGTPLQRSKVLYSYHLYQFRVQRYVVSDEVMAAVESNLTVVEQTGKLTTIYDHHFTTGFFHLFRRELDDAEKQLHLCLAMAERMGDPIRISRAANYLMYAARMRGQPELAQRYFDTVLSTTWAGPMADYTYTVQGCQAWIAWRARKLAEARAVGIKAREALRGPFSHSPFYWIVYFPLLAVALAENQLAEAYEYVPPMLHPSQMIFPNDLAAQLETAVKAGEAADYDTARAALAEAIRLATAYGYL
jgi:eukaryotic-like serine/threonine-protein kinase